MEIVKIDLPREYYLVVYDKEKIVKYFTRLTPSDIKFLNLNPRNELNAGIFARVGASSCEIDKEILFEKEKEIRKRGNYHILRAMEILKENKDLEVEYTRIGFSRYMAELKINSFIPWKFGELLGHGKIEYEWKD